MSGWNDPILGNTTLRRAAEQSPNYVAGVSGWSVNADGSAEFNDVIFRGSVVDVNNTVTINSNGIFMYGG